MALQTRRTILFKPGASAGNSEIAFIYQPSRRVAHSAKPSGRFKDAGRTCENKKPHKPHHLHFVYLTDLTDVFK